MFSSPSAAALAMLVLLSAVLLATPPSSISWSMEASRAVVSVSGSCLGTTVVSEFVRDCPPGAAVDELGGSCDAVCDVTGGGCDEDGTGGCDDDGSAMVGCERRTKQRRGKPSDPMGKWARKRKSKR